MVCIFGSCRVFYGQKYNGPYRPFSFTHSSKVVLQLLKWKDKPVDELKNIYCNELFLLSDKITTEDDFIEIIGRIKNYVDKSNLIIIEICSMKEVIFKDIYLLHNRVNKSILKRQYYIKYPNEKNKDMFKNVRFIKQNNPEILGDLERIYKILKNKKILFLPHFTAKIDNKTNKYIEERIMSKKILKEFCSNKDNCILFDHLDYVEDNAETFYLHIDGHLDSCHMSWETRDFITLKLHELVNKFKN